MGEARPQDAQTRRGFTGLLTAAAFAPAVARAQIAAPQIILPQSVLAPPTPAPVLPPGEATVVKAAEDENARMTVPVMVNGKGPFPFVVDTGSNRTVISDTLAAQLQLPAGEVLQVSSALSVDAAPSAVISRLTVGKHEISNVVAPVLFRGNLGAAGMLGIDAVADQIIVMDFKSRVMRIQPSVRREEDASTVVVKAKSKYGQLILVDAFVEGIQLYVIIDTGGEMTIGNMNLRNALLRRRQHEANPVILTSVMGEEAQADLSLLPRVTIGQVDVGNMEIAYTDMHAFDQFGLHDKPSMLLGMNTLRHFQRVLVDFKARQVRFQFDDPGIHVSNTSSIFNRD